MDTRTSPSQQLSPARRPGPVVVGVDAVGRSTSAVVWATEEADRTGAALHLVHAGQERTDGPLAAGAASLARRLTMAELDCRVVPGRPVDALVDAAASASLLVLGRRRLVGALRMLPGSTSFAVAGRSRVPVVVVPERWVQPSMSSAPVVVGVSPDVGNVSSSDGPMLKFAAGRAARLRVPLVVVGAWDVPSVYAWPPTDVEAWRSRNQTALERRMAPVRRAYPDLEIALRAVAEPAGRALLEGGRIGQLTVVGRSRGRRAGFAMGATARDVLRGAERPVAVVAVDEARSGDPAGAPDVPAWAPMF